MNKKTFKKILVESRIKDSNTVISITRYTC